MFIIKERGAKVSLFLFGQCSIILIKNIMKGFNINLLIIRTGFIVSIGGLILVSLIAMFV